MHCPLCHADDTKVVDSRLAEEGAAVRRRRQCPPCAHRFTTFERVDEVPLTSSSSPTAAPSRSTGPRSSAGSLAATKGRASRRTSRSSSIADAVEDAVRLQGAEVTERPDRARRARPAVRTIDEVAYLRFASVYKNFDAAADFHREIELLSKLGAERR